MFLPAQCLTYDTKSGGGRGSSSFREGLDKNASASRMAAKEVVIVILCFVSCLYVGVHAQARDLTLEPDTSGSDVVRAAIAKVLTASRDQTQIFGNRLFGNRLFGNRLKSVKLLAAAQECVCGNRRWHCR